MPRDPSRPRRHGVLGALDLFDRAFTAVAVLVLALLVVLTALYWLVRLLLGL